MFSAAELPMLIKAMMIKIDRLNKIELRGIGVPITTTLRNQLENGRAWSRARAQACRDAAARALSEVHTLRMMGMQVMQTVPARELVEARKTSTKGNGDSEPTTASMLVMQKHWLVSLAWLVSGRARSFAYIGDDEDESHDAVQQDGADNHSRHRFAGIPRLFSQVSGCIGSRERSSRCDRPDKAGRAESWPSAEVREGAEDLARVGLGGENPQRYNNDEEA